VSTDVQGLGGGGGIGSPVLGAKKPSFAVPPNVPGGTTSLHAGTSTRGDGDGAQLTGTVKASARVGHDGVGSPLPASAPQGPHYVPKFPPAHRLTKADVRALFRDIDRDANGYVTVGELRDGLTAAGASVPNVATLARLFERADTSHQGRIGEDGLVGLLAGHTLLSLQRILDGDGSAGVGGSGVHTPTATSPADRESP